MNIKHLSTVLLLSLTLLLVACVDSISSENETLYGRFSTSDLEQETADKLIREVVDFEYTNYGEVSFIEGYSVLNTNTGASLYVGVYDFEKPELKDFQLERDAKALQDYSKKGWKRITDNKDEQGYGKNDETIYDASVSFSASNQDTPYVAVKVEYNKYDRTFWIYYATPDEMIAAINSDQINQLFADYRSSKRK